MSLESALEEERIEILKLLHKDEDEQPLQLPVLPQRVSRSASPMRFRRHKSKSKSPSEASNGGLPGVPPGGKITQSALVKNFHNLSPAAQELLLSTSAVPELLKASAEPKQGSDRERRPSSSALEAPKSMLLPSAGPELAPYPSIHGPTSHPANHRRASSFGADGGPLRKYKSADDTQQSVIAYLTESGPAPSPPTPGSPLTPTFSSSTSRSRSPAARRKSSSGAPVEEDFSTAYRRLSRNALLKAGSKLAPDAPKNMEDRLEKDEEDEDGAIADSSSSDDQDDDSDSGSDIEDTVSRQAGMRRAPQSLLAAMEDERKAVTTSKRYTVQSLITAPPPSHIDGAFASYKRHLIHPKTAFDLVDDALKDSPYTSDKEEAADIRKAVNMPVKVSDIESNRAAGRVLRTITRGDFKSVSSDASVKKRSYIVATDASPESMYALEWTVGTILRDGNIMYAVCALEEPEEGEKPEKGGAPMDEAGREQERLSIAKEISSMVVKLLKKTRLQVECVVEVMHCKSPKHLICDVIDYLSPTMVILGSRGRSALKGILLGSFSNYLVTKSSVPVMVARKKLKKSKHQTIPAKFSNNLREGVSSLSMAKVD